MAILQCDMHSVNRQQHTGLLQSGYIQMTHNRSKHKDVKTFRGLHADLTEEEHDWRHFTIIVGILKDSACAATWTLVSAETTFNVNCAAILE